MRNENNPSAFPRPVEETVQKRSLQIPGMSLRDYFAAAALTGIYAAYRPTDELQRLTDTASDAYRVADAMLTERAIYLEHGDE